MPTLPAGGRGGHCTVHGSHRPAVSGTEIHHVWPKGMGGPDVADNRVEVCPTGHTNIHNWMAYRLYLTGHLQRPTPLPIPLATVAEKKLAERGIADWIAAGKPGDVTAAYALHVH